mgnify:CR=1 FL=1|tara:strand:- start:82 stop:459 length:378 start_codon:yes stop_codon:yes gene_type:complete
MDEWKFPNFKPEEFACRHCGENKINLDFVAKLQELRTAVNMPLKITSGYRCKDHPIEARKKTPGAHNEGSAVDINCAGSDAYKIISMALELKFPRIGVNMKGDYNTRFIHLDCSETRPGPTIWSY